ncbi:MAG TPA: hypothetical protein VLJ84_12880 [Usitatibacter sp.]|nr:hypothetical protein [Usitatibacter sp.]
MPLDLLVPDLLLPEDAPGRLREARLPHAEKWLARGASLRGPRSDALRWIARSYGLQEPIPSAAISRIGEGGEAEGQWLRADPVHLRVENDGLVLHDPAALSLTLDEAEALAAALARQLAADGLAFEVLAPGRWYVRYRGEAPRTVALADAFGRNIFGLLPKGSGDLSWANLLTEAQMVLAGHAVNEARNPPVNSVWFWGEGAAPPALAHRYDVIYAEDPFPRGVARLSGARAEPAPARMETLLANPDESALVVIESLTVPLHRADTDAWLAAAARLDADWFAGLGEAISRWGTVRIVLPGERATHVVTLTPSARWRWFRPRQRLAAHA